MINRLRIEIDNLALEFVINAVAKARLLKIVDSTAEDEFGIALDRALAGLPNPPANTEPEDEHVFCPTCKAEVYWVKGWYDCDSCGQLKEHPLMDTANTEPEDETCYKCGMTPTLLCGCDIPDEQANTIALRKIEEYWKTIASTKYTLVEQQAIADCVNWLQQEDK